ncbi:hypothetical protein SLEP1_g48757 [Rubroshorea leprosula]|uniref:Uncharacterized protein n=1 Tax=Rubroshorea leprosula TaxID=152421 RepID=A0AAV5LUV0_9ROSI|nr:hypothetical protein SLEP1_g48757 [Rubroshorea leprosula]
MLDIFRALCICGTLSQVHGVCHVPGSGFWGVTDPLYRSLLKESTHPQDHSLIAQEEDYKQRSLKDQKLKLKLKVGYPSLQAILFSSRVGCKTLSRLWNSDFKYIQKSRPLCIKCILTIGCKVGAGFASFLRVRQTTVFKFLLVELAAASRVGSLHFHFTRAGCSFQEPALCTF